MSRRGGDYDGLPESLATVFAPPAEGHLLRGGGLYWGMPSRHRTHREIEIKLRIGDAATLLRRLRQMGAQPLGRVFESNTLYDTPDSDFRSRGRLLRLRIETPAPSRLAGPGPRRSVITAKAPVPGATTSAYKEKMEREAAIQIPGRWGRALRRIGLVPGFRYEKFRTAFRLPGLQMALDETPVGVFLEIEGAPRAIDRAAKTLGDTRGGYIRGTYWDLYAEDCRRRRRLPRNMMFRG